MPISQIMEEIKIAVSVFVVLLGGFFALTQIRANNITNARIKWFESLRTLLTEFFTASFDLQMKEGVYSGIEERRHLVPITQSTENYLQSIKESSIERLTAFEHKYNLLLLQLNPKEPLHIKLEKLITEYTHLHNKIPSSRSQIDFIKLSRTLEAYSDTILLLSRFMLKIEWDKTKRNGLQRWYYMKIGKGRKLLREAINMPLKPERTGPPQL